MNSIYQAKNGIIFVKFVLTCYNSFITDDAPARGRRQSRKRLRQPSLWERNVRKKKKARGEEHVSTTGKLNKAQPMRSPY